MSRNRHAARKRRLCSQSARKVHQTAQRAQQLNARISAARETGDGTEEGCILVVVSEEAKYRLDHAHGSTESTILEDLHALQTECDPEAVRHVVARTIAVASGNGRMVSGGQKKQPSR